MLKGKCVVLGVTGSIAAYKIAYLASALVKQHADVHVIMTENATNFINPITLRRSQATSVWSIHLTGISSSMSSMWHWQSVQIFLWWRRLLPM